MAIKNNDLEKKALLKLGKHIRDVRKARDLSQEKLAEEMGVHRTYIGMIERGEKNPTYITILRLACALKISISELVKNE
ncbi:helix-turn-helix domain-containing protein [Latilactobacillus curvatus]|uniref:helix-turn-helix domain-containing protein n=1 Tax=Latilactobacillus curvatus TaxID=28038 RepID=UPI0021A6429A|nr:helix-turn-helix transcriptional regulator [Latilactobacillus curvatus]MCT2880768.1 XRE family transcriptional regulator [Latilactobacillus curvatus]